MLPSEVFWTYSSSLLASLSKREFIGEPLGSYRIHGKVKNWESRRVEIWPAWETSTTKCYHTLTHLPAHRFCVSVQNLQWPAKRMWLAHWMSALQWMDCPWEVRQLFTEVISRHGNITKPVDTQEKYPIPTLIPLSILSSLFSPDNLHI